MLHAFLPPTGRFAYLTNIKLIFSSSFMLTSHKQVFAFFFSLQWGYVIIYTDRLHLNSLKLGNIFLFPLPFSQSSPPTVFLIEHEMNIDLFPALVGVIQAVDTDKSTLGQSLGLICYSSFLKL